jgi:hypothetical protein
MEDAMHATGYLFLSVNDGPVVSVPVTVETGRLMLEMWFGDLDASSADPALRCRIEGILTALSAAPE